MRMVVRVSVCELRTSMLPGGLLVAILALNAGFWCALYHGHVAWEAFICQIHCCMEFAGRRMVSHIDFDDLCCRLEEAASVTCPI